MSRLHLYETIVDQYGRPVNGAVVTIRDKGTINTVSTALLFAAETGGTTLPTNPVTTGADGLVEAWLDDATAIEDVDLLVVIPGGDAAGFTVRAHPRISVADVVTKTRVQTITGQKTFTNAILPGAVMTSLAGTLAPGTVGDPALKWATEATTGPYRPGTGGWGLAVNGAVRSIATVDSLQVYRGNLAAIEIIAGTAGAPVDQTSPGVSRFGGSERYGAIDANLYSTMSNVVEAAAITGRHYAQAGSEGYAYGVRGYVKAQGSWTSAGEDGLIGVIGEAESALNGATLKGANFIARSLSSSQNGSFLLGAEVNVENRSQLMPRRGIVVGAVGGSNHDAVAGYLADWENDVGYALTRKAPGAPWTVGFGVLAPSTVFTALLNGAVNSSVTTLTYDNRVGALPTAPFDIVVESGTTTPEKMTVTAHNATTMTVTRGTPAYAHADNATIGIADGSPDFPIRADGTIFKVVGTNRSTGGPASVGTGFDLSGILITGNAWISNGATITGGGLGTFAGLTNNGDFTSVGNGRKFTGNYGDGNVFNRPYFQSNVAANSTLVSAIPNATGTTAGFEAYSASISSDVQALVQATPTAMQIRSQSPIAAYKPIDFYANNILHTRMATDGSLQPQGSIYPTGQTTTRYTALVGALAANGTLVLGTTAQIGFALISDSTNGYGAVISLNGGLSTTTLLSSTDATKWAVTDTGTEWAVYWSGSQYILKNRSAGTRNYRLHFLGT